MTAPRGTLLRYIVVGGVIGVASTVLIGIVGHVMTLGPAAYAAGVACVYFTCSIASFILHARITFRVQVPRSRFGRHLLVNAGAAAATGIMSSAIRAILPQSVAEFPLSAATSDAAAFVIASLLIALASYATSRAFVFHSPAIAPGEPP